MWKYTLVSLRFYFHFSPRKANNFLFSPCFLDPYMTWLYPGLRQAWLSQVSTRFSWPLIKTHYFSDSFLRGLLGAILAKMLSLDEGRIQVKQKNYSWHCNHLLSITKVIKYTAANLKLWKHVNGKIKILQSNYYYLQNIGKNKIKIDITAQATYTLFTCHCMAFSR